MFADEAGDFEFVKKQNVSKYFILCTVSMESCEVAKDLLDLRRELAWDGHELGDYFHCTSDSQAVRNEVFAAICDHKFRIQATIMEKTKAQPQVRKTRHRFYQYGWYYHFKYGAPAELQRNGQNLLITTASLGTGKEKAAFSGAVEDVMRQTIKGSAITVFTPASADPCVQVADYCAWAIQRKWERGDARSYDLIKDRITYEFDLWKRGTIHHY
jgi:hypothetical protein